MNDPAQLLANLASRAIERGDATREENRRHFTAGAELMDAFAWASPRMVYAQENGRELGRKSDGWIPWRIYEPFTNERNATNENAHRMPVLDEKNAARGGHLGKPATRWPSRRR